MRKEVKAYFDETLDMSSYDTLTTVMSFNEAEQGNAIMLLANKLYNMIVNKLEDIDFKEIERSKGDITKFAQYKKTKESIDTLMTIANQSKSGIEEVNVLNECMKNLEENKDIFVKGFKNDISIIKYFYNTAVLGLISDIGFMTVVCVEFIKNPESNVGLEIKNLEQYKTKFYLVHRNLIKFNESCSKGELQKCFNTLSNYKVKHESIAVVGIIGSIIAVASVLVYFVIPFLRDLTYLFFSFRTKLSDWFGVQSELLNANTTRLKALKAKNDTETKNVIEAQNKWSNRMKKISEFLAIKYIPAAKNAERQSAIDSKTTIKKDEVNEIDDRVSSLF